MNTVEEKVMNIVAEKLCVELSEVTREANFIQDLGADSMDIAELVLGLETEFNVTIEDEEMKARPTVGAVIDYIESLNK